MGKKDHLFNPAFEKLGSIVEVFQKDFQDSDSRDPEENASIPDDDAYYFKEAMSGVLPLPGHRRKAARSPGILSKFTFLYSSSSATVVVFPFRSVIETGTTSSLNFPAFQDAADS